MLDQYWLIQNIQLTEIDIPKQKYRYIIVHVDKAIWNNKDNHDSYNFIIPIGRSIWEKNF